MTLSYKEVADIVKIVDSSDCEELILEMDKMRLVVRRGETRNETQSKVTAKPAASASVSSVSAPAPQPSVAEKTNTVTKIGDTSEGIVSSPMVGTFYRCPSAGEVPFIEVGSKVSAGDPLCLIEVMKLYTTMEATSDGTIKAILADDASLVEFGQPLFIIV